MERFDYRESRLCIGDDGVAVFEHLRGEARNPLTMDLRADYAQMLSQVQADARIRALVITGGIGCFSAGGDAPAAAGSACLVAAPA